MNYRWSFIEGVRPKLEEGSRPTRVRLLSKIVAVSVLPPIPCLAIIAAYPCGALVRHGATNTDFGTDLLLLNWVACGE